MSDWLLQLPRALPSVAAAAAPPLRPGLPLQVRIGPDLTHQLHCCCIAMHMLASFHSLHDCVRTPLRSTTGAVPAALLRMDTSHHNVQADDDAARPEGAAASMTAELLPGISAFQGRDTHRARPCKLQLSCRSAQESWGKPPCTMSISVTWVPAEILMVCVEAACTVSSPSKQCPACGGL